MSTFELQSRARIARTLGPVLSLAVLTVLVGCTPADSGTSGNQTSSSSSVMMQSSSSVVMDDQAYTDGTFSAEGAYRSPAGGELVNVTLTLDGGVITDASFSGTATNPKSKVMQAAFASGFKTQVVGKSLDEISVGVVNGSSLTGNGFMEAVAKIKAEAKS